MKAWSVALALSLLLAGCTTDDGQDPGLVVQSDPPVSDEEEFGFMVDTPTDPIAATAWNVTGTVAQPTKVAATQGPVHDFVGEHLDVNGSWSIMVAVEPGSQEIWVELQEIDGDGYAFVVLDVNVLAMATVQIDYGSASSKEPVEDTVWVDLVDYDAQSHYDDEDVKHPEYANIHDVMAAWEEQQGHTIDYSYNQGFGSFGVERIDGEGNSLSAGEPPWWCYQVNGEYASQGITPQRFGTGDVIAWDLGTCGGVMGGT